MSQEQEATNLAGAAETWKCPHGTVYSGSSDYVNGARNAHQEVEARAGEPSHRAFCAALSAAANSYHVLNSNAMLNALRAAYAADGRGTAASIGAVSSERKGTAGGTHG